VSLPRSARRVQEALHELGVDVEVVELSDSTRTAPEAAAAVGCELGAIVKSLVFRGAHSGEPVLVLVSGDRRADEAALAEALGEPVQRAEAGWVREVTGYAIGGVAPVGHPAPVRTLIDDDLMRFETVWAAAGTPRTVFPIAPELLARVTGAAPARPRD
jgi:prolyl-tRNA editing enzyme YbaK/EbsC (Cys-tRNA(Pro) deacylase)